MFSTTFAISFLQSCICKNERIFKDSFLECKSGTTTAPISIETRGHKEFSACLEAPLVKSFLTGGTLHISDFKQLGCASLHLAPLCIEIVLSGYLCSVHSFNLTCSKPCWMLKRKKFCCSMPYLYVISSSKSPATFSVPAAMSFKDSKRGLIFLPISLDTSTSVPTLTMQPIFLSGQV